VYVSLPYAFPPPIICGFLLLSSLFEGVSFTLGFPRLIFTFESFLSLLSESVFPVPASEDERSFCVSVHDRCASRLKELDRFYMPEPIERTAPDRQKLLWLIRQALSEGNSAKIKAQQDGKQFSRLFGSRG